MSDARDDGWAKFGLQLYRPQLAGADPEIDGRFRIFEGSACGSTTECAPPRVRRGTMLHPASRRLLQRSTVLQSSRATCAAQARCCVAAGEGCSMDDQCCSGDRVSARCR